MIQKIKECKSLLMEAKTTESENNRQAEQLKQQKIDIPKRIAEEQEKIKKAGVTGGSISEVEVIVNNANSEILKLNNEATLIIQKIKFLSNLKATDIEAVGIATKNLAQSKRAFIYEMEKKAIKNKDFMAILSEIKSAWDHYAASEGFRIRDDIWIENICEAVPDDEKHDKKMVTIFQGE